MTGIFRFMIVAGCCAWASAALAQEQTPGAAAAGSSAHGKPTVEIQAFLETVAGSTGKQFLVHGMVPPMIYVGGTELDDPSYPLLLSILRNNGLAAVEIEGYVNVMPDAVIRQLPMRIVQRDDPAIPDDEWVTRILPVRKGQATQLVPILRPLLPQAGHLTVTGEESDYKLLIVASYAKVKQITELVRLLTE